MKYILSFLITLFLCPGIAGAKPKFDPAKFRADLHKYITTEAHLTSEEAEKFFPLYDEMKAKQMKLYRGGGHPFHKKPATEAACRAEIIRLDNIEIKKRQIERTYHMKFMKILSASKLYDVLRAEARFHRIAFRDAARKNQKH